jgi:predicted dehydrogenase
MASTRREFMKSAGGAAAALSLSSALPIDLAGQTTGAGAKKRYAIIGTGVRGLSMWGRDLKERYPDVLEFVGLCDINSKRVEIAKTSLGVNCPTFTDFDKMIDTVKPELLTITTVDAFHSEYIVRALDRGIDVITEKPMVIDEKQCEAVLEAERRNKRKISVGFNYRFAPKHVKIKEILSSNELGPIRSVDFHWYLDVRHGADYFRRWHRLTSKGGSLWVHKASHHFDLINWWLGADPVEVQAHGVRQKYGDAGPFRHSHCRPCPHKTKCEFYWDISKMRNAALYTEAESEDKYYRDGCVFREDCDIPDSMTASIKYSNGALMSYSLNTFMPIEGYHLAFNCANGRLEVRDYERQAWETPDETEMYVIKNFGQRTKVEIPKATGGHGGGDDVLRDQIFRKTEVADYLKVPDSRAGAMSCLTGIAARKSVAEKRPIRIADLTSLT